MRPFIPVLFALTACTEEQVCDLVGSYSGTFSGDAEGNVEITVTAGDGTTIIETSIENETVAALGDGTINCEDGSFVVELETDAGELLGEFEGSLAEGAGDGTWEFTEGDLAGYAGTWSVGE
ncbi:MAG: hypothetical protein FJ102_22095 [Deltaproteobacteria bacterium]|nr:hypothetical protein [Deltaproteobacteria bacterium]